MMVKATLLGALFSLIVILTLSGLLLVNLCKADPFPFEIMDEVPPDDQTKPPTVHILSPDNDTSYAGNKVVLSIQVEVGYSATAVVPLPYLWEIYYEADWQRGSTSIYNFENPANGGKTLSKFNTTINLKGVPEGSHILSVYAVEKGRYEKLGPVVEYYPFKITGSSTTQFTVDATPPSILVLSVENGTLDASEVNVEFVVDEPVQQFSYVLDGLANETIEGNFTLNGLSSGTHNLTIYAIDEAGNVGASETIDLAIALQPPTIPSSSPSVHPSLSPSTSASDQQPTSSTTQQSAALPAELVYSSIVAVAVVTAVAVSVVYLRRKA